MPNPLDHPYGFVSLLPPLAAVLLAIATRRVLLSLGAGLLLGALIVAQWNPVLAVRLAVGKYLFGSVWDADHGLVLAFTLLMGAMVGVVHVGGGMHALVDRLARVARNRRGGQLTVWGLGLAVFFDDYANSLLLGSTMRPLMDRLKVSREKLAFLVDSTAAPVAGLAVVSTWVAGEIGYIGDGLDQVRLAGGPVDPLAVFVATIPYRFYVLWMLLLVPMIAILGRDFGPMLRAERRAAGHAPPGDRPARHDALARLPEPEPGVPRRWINALGPVALVVAVTLGVWFATGVRAVAAASEGPAGWIDVMEAGDSYTALVFGSAAGWGLAVLLAGAQRAARGAQLVRATLAGARMMMPAMFILWLAWALAEVSGRGDLRTGEYLGSLLEGRIDVAWMPSVVFLAASLVAFSTGTSWGTMGILTPLVVPIVCRMLQAAGSVPSADAPILLASIGSVLAGAIFGDHCSPISDTTVLSSRASGCDHIAHVWTQLPYALVVGAVAILLGTLPVGLGAPVWLLLPAGPIALLVVVRFVGRTSVGPG